MKHFAILGLIEATFLAAAPPQAPPPPQAPAPREKGLPAGYPAAPDGYEWRRDDRGPDGWGLFQVAPTASVTSPQRAAPVTQYGWRQVCTGNGCRLVYGPLP